MKKHLLVFLLFTCYASYGITNISGNFNVGTGQTYTSLTNNSATGLFKFLNSIDGVNTVISGPITVTILSDISIEDGTVQLHALHYDANGPYTITIQPDTSSMRIISGGPNISGTGLIAFNGAGNIIIDGSYNGSGKYLKFTNSTFYVVYTILGFINGANNITVRNCLLEGSAIGDNLGSINILTSAGPDGNHHLVFDNNEIGNNAYIDTRIYCSGSAGYPNHDISITNNNIFNFIDGYNSMNNYGINITSTGNGSTFIIRGNSFYQTGVCNSGAYHTSAITFLPGAASTGDTISGNYIGGNLPLCAPGTTPAPGYWCENNGNSSSQVSNLVDINCGEIYISDNTIKNIRIQGQNHSYTLLNISGTTTTTIYNNHFGDLNQSLRVSIEQISGDTYLKGIANASTGAVIVSGNDFNNLWATSSSGYAFSEPIVFSAASSGSQVISNSINGCKATGGNYLLDNNNIGINIYPSSGSISNLLINNNYINIPVSTTSTGYYNIGISVQAATVSGTILSDNNILGYGGTTGGKVYGIYMAVTGSGQSDYKVVNNMADLTSYGGSSNVALYGINEASCAGTGSSADYWFNSVYVGGSNTGSNSSYCFYNNSCYGTGNGPTLTLYNNILLNNRSGGTGIHYAVYNQHLESGWHAGSSDYNFIASRGTVAYWASSGAMSFNQWQSASGGDGNSISAAISSTTSYTGAPYPGSNTLSPTDLFMGTANDLHIRTDASAYQFVSNNGFDLTSNNITTDIDGETRCPNSGCAGSASAPDIGADEFSAGPTGIASVKINPQLLIYPNPATNQVYIRADQLMISSLIVLNVLGDAIDVPIVNNGRIYTMDISKLKPGIYFLRLVTGNDITVKKFVKE